MLCPNCATENPDGAKACGKCGQALSRQDPPAAASEETAYAGEWKDDPDLVHVGSQDKKRKKRGRRILMAAVLVAALLALGLLGGRVVVSRLYTAQISVAQQFLNEQKYADAATALEKAARLRPKEKQVYLLLAQAYTGAKEFDRGVGQLERGADATGDPEVRTALTELQAKQEEARQRAADEQAAQQAAGKLHWAVQPGMAFDSLTVPGTQLGEGGAAYSGVPDYTGTVLVTKGGATRLLGYDGKDILPDGYTARLCDTCGIVARRTGAADAQEWLIGPDGTVLGRHTDAPTQGYRFQGGAVCLSGSGQKAEGWDQAALLPVLSKSGQAQGYAFVGSDGKQVGDTYAGAGVFSEGLAAVQKDGKWGYIDRTGAEKIPFLFDRAYPFQGGLAAVVWNGKAGFIDSDGTLSLGFCYEDARSPHAGKAWVKQDGKWGVLDLGQTGPGTAWEQVYLQKLRDLVFPLGRSSWRAGLWDWDGDGTPELFLSDGTLCTVYTAAQGAARPLGCLAGERLYAGKQGGQLFSSVSNLDTFQGATAVLGENDAARSLYTRYDTGVLACRLDEGAITGSAAVLLAMPGTGTYLQDGKTVTETAYLSALSEACPAAREIQLTRLSADGIAALDPAALRARTTLDASASGGAFPESGAASPQAAGAGTGGTFAAQSGNPETGFQGGVS